MTRSRSFKWVAGILLTLILILALIVVFFDWNWLREPIARKVTEQTGRALAISGNLNVKLGWPLIRVHAAGVTFANPAWAKERQMISVDDVDFSLDIPTLLHRKIRMPEVQLNHPTVFLEINAEGRKNWLLDKQQLDENTKIPIGRMTVNQGRIMFDNDKEDTSIHADVSTQDTQQQTSNGGIVFSVSGQYKRLPLTANGSGGPVLALEDETLPYPLKIDARIGKSGVVADGRITNLIKLSAVDMNIDLHGESLALLYPLIGIALPETGSYSTRGHLVHNGGMWRYEGFSGHIGKSDIAGMLQVDSGAARPFMHGELSSNLLDIADLGPVIGTKATTDITVSGPPPGQEQSQGTTKKSAGSANATTTIVRTGTQVLPKVPFQTKRWDSVDADVKINAKRIQRPKELPIENLVTHLQMRDSQIMLDPLDFGIAGGHLAGTVTLDGRQEPIQAHAKMKVSQLVLNKMFPTLKLNKTSVGQINGAFDLAGRGDAVASMLGTSNGKMSMIIDGGQISRLMMEAISLHLLEILQLKLTGDQIININCGAADFNVKNGTMNTNLLLLDTDVTSIFGDGTIDLSSERMHMTINQKTKKTSPVALTSPILVEGTFGHPDVHLDKKRIATRGLGALALGAIMPLLALIPLVDPNTGFQNECSKILQQEHVHMPAAKPN